MELSDETASPGVLRVKETADKLINNVSKVIVGKREITELILTALLAGGHVLLEDVPGVGKTLLAKTAARTLGCTFKRIQCTPDLFAVRCNRHTVF